MGFTSWLRGLLGNEAEEAAPPVAEESSEVSVEEPAPDLPEEIVTPEEAEEEPRRPHKLVSGILGVAWMTDVGSVRDHNEDGLFILIGEQQSDAPLPPFGLFVLADGMGGHQAGEVASAIATRTVAGHLLAHVYQPLLRSADHTATQPSLTEIVSDALLEANRDVSQTVPGSGTTLTCGLVIGNRLFIGHVGDSRAYLWRAQEPVKMLTTDHSVVTQLVEIGQLTSEEAAVHPQRNMLYRAIGQGVALEVDVSTHALQSGDLLVLCSDGLWGLLPDEKMWSIISAASTLDEACVGLVDAANAAGGNDNITVILVEMRQDIT
ncbi:MAG: protein phosphatase 2C domain-containing protein [Anaerolineales bacterium]